MRRNCWIDIIDTDDREVALSSDSDGVTLEIWDEGPFGGTNSHIDFPGVETQQQLETLCKFLGINHENSSKSN